MSTLNEVLKFMTDPENICNCESCPENKDFSAWPGNRLPCGQFKCWIELNTESDDSDYEDEDEEEFDYEYDRCYECTGYGDDYFLNDDGELESACFDCPFFEG